VISQAELKAISDRYKQVARYYKRTLEEKTK